VPKEDNSLYVPNLIPDTVYTFNISAKYLDGSYGAAYSIRLDTGDAMMTRTTSSRDIGLYFLLTVYMSWLTTLQWKLLCSRFCPLLNGET